MSGQRESQQVMMELTHRARAMLRAVAAGRAHVSLSCEPDLFVDGLPCCDQMAAHSLVHAGLIRSTRPGRVGERVPAALTTLGESVMAVHDPRHSGAAGRLAG